MSLLDLRRKRGDLWDAAAWNRHLEEIDRFLQNITPGGPGGTSRRTAAPGPVFFTLAADAGQANGEWLLRVGFGLAAGVEPIIAGRRISEVDAETGETPALTVRDGDFSGAPKNAGDWPKGAAFIYARVQFAPAWDLEKVEIIARATPWTVQPWQTARLIGLLRRDDPEDVGSDVSPVQLTLFNQALTLSQKGSAGRARYWWRATF